MLNKLYDFLELQLFGVCTWWSNKLGIKTGKVRLYFIYLSFIAFGSPLVVYLVMAYILDHKFYFKPKARRASLDL